MVEGAGGSVNSSAANAGDRPSGEQVQLLIDELRHRSDELECANRELRRVSHYRSLFLARMSHELRTPLTAILGFTEILLDQEKLTDAQRRFCQKVQNSALQLQASLNQLVDLSRLEAGTTEVFLQEFSFRETLRESCAAATRLAQKQQVKIEYELAPDVNTIVSDQGKLRQVIFNFAAWAIGRSPAGETVRISVGLDGNRLWIKMADVGGPVKDTDGIFDSDGVASSREPSMNELGVIIAKRLLELLDGRVALNSIDDTGVEISIDVPARPLKG
jgi:cell cycle sensor histidine kinase DivJ